MTIEAGPRDATFLGLEDEVDAAFAARTDEELERIALRIDPERDPVALVFASRRPGGRPHVVTVQTLTSGDVLTCTCESVRSTSPTGCYRMVRAREILGWPPE